MPSSDTSERGLKWAIHCSNRLRVPLGPIERGSMTLRGHVYFGASGVIDKVDEYVIDDDLPLIAEDGADQVLRSLPQAIIARRKFWVGDCVHTRRPRRGNLEYLATVMEHLAHQPWFSGVVQPKLTAMRLMSVSVAAAPPGEKDQ